MPQLTARRLQSLRGPCTVHRWDRHGAAASAHDSWGTRTVPLFSKRRVLSAYGSGGRNVYVLDSALATSKPSSIDLELLQTAPTLIAWSFPTLATALIAILATNRADAPAFFTAQLVHR